MGQEQSLHGRRYTTPRRLAMGYCGTSLQAVDMDVPIDVERLVRKAIDSHWVNVAAGILLPSPRRPCPTSLHDRCSAATLIEAICRVGRLRRDRERLRAPTGLGLDGRLPKLAHWRSALRRLAPISYRVPTPPTPEPLASPLRRSVRRPDRSLADGGRRDSWTGNLPIPH